MKQDVNPYAAPLDSSSDSGRPVAADVIVDRLTFRGELTLEHQRDAVRRTGIRPDLKRVNRLALTMVIAFTFVSGILLSGTSNNPYGFSGVAFGYLFCLCGALAIYLPQRYLALTLFPAFQSTRGEINGWLDQDGIRIDSMNQSQYTPMDAIVSSAFDKEIWAISFSRQTFQWMTLPFDFFSDPVLARSVATDLRRLYPPTKPQATDTRRWQEPQAEPAFKPSGPHLAFGGVVYEEMLATTRFFRWMKRLNRRNNLCIFLMFACIAMGFGIQFGFSFEMIVYGAIYLILFFSMMWLRVWRHSRRAKQVGGTVLFHSKGWVGTEGIFAMTAIGQSHSKWGLFNDFEITEQSVVLYPDPDHDFGVCLGREQFSSEADWDQACEFIRTGMRH